MMETVTIITMIVINDNALIVMMVINGDSDNSYINAYKLCVHAEVIHCSRFLIYCADQHVFTLIYICQLICMYMYVRMCMYMYVYVCMCMYMYVCACICIYMYVYACICMCIQDRIPYWAKRKHLNDEGKYCKMCQLCIQMVHS